MKLRALMERGRSGDNSGRAEKLLSVNALVAHAGKLAGVRLDGYDHSVDVYAIRHVIEHHGGDAERRRGQLPVTDEDVQAIPEIVTSPDYVAFGPKSRNGKDLVVYFKRMPNGTVPHLEEIRTGQRQLALHAIRKYPATIAASSVLTPANLNARNDGGDEFIVVDPLAGVKVTVHRSAFGDGG